MRRKEARVEVRMTEHEKEALKRKAAKNGMTVSEYARTLLANSDDATIRVIDTEPLRKAAHELAKQGTNLNQFMRFLNTYGSNALDHEEAKAVLGELGNREGLRIDLIVSLGCTPSSACDAFVSKPLDVLANVVIEGIDLVTVLFRLILIEDDGEAPRLHCRFSHMVSVL